MIRRPPISPLFPSPPLSRSRVFARRGRDVDAGVAPPFAAGDIPHQTLQRAEPGLEQLRERSEEHTSELQSQSNLVCRLLLEKKKKKRNKDEDATQKAYGE